MKVFVRWQMLCLEIQPWKFWTIDVNDITSNGLCAITRMIVLTLLQTIWFASASNGIFEDKDDSQIFVSTLLQSKSSGQELPNNFPILDQEQQSSYPCHQCQEQLDTQSAIEPCRFALGSSATATTTATTTACNQQHDAQDLAQGHHKVCHRPQPCWNECDFETVPSPTDTAGKKRIKQPAATVTTTTTGS
jgi:hypothetical protein